MRLLLVFAIYFGQFQLSLSQNNACYLPKDPGPCKALFPKFYHDPLTCRCRKFNYGGCGGNGNRFSTMEECKEECNGAVCPVCSLPAETGMCLAYFPKYFFNVQTCQCEEFIYGGCGGNGNRYDTIEECKSVCANFQCPVCNLPPATGPCEALLERWYFDAAECICKPFTYGGCKGNYNRFNSKEDCEGSCGSFPCPVCSEPVKVGPCRAAINRWYYDDQTDKCKRFSWGGCQPNGNNFKTRGQCNKVCKGFVCSLPKKEGPCEAAIPRFYYDADLNVCKRFYWGGCEPNGNNFERKRRCKRRCIRQ